MASVEEPIEVQHKAEKIKHFEAMLGILGSPTNSSSNKFDDFQLTLFDLISNASEEGVLQCFNQKSTDIYKFILSLFIASLHKDNPLRLANDNTSQSQLLSTPPNGKVINKKRGSSNENPLNSVLVSPATTLPPPPKRRNSEKKEDPKPTEHKAPELPSDPNKNNNVSGIGDDMVQRQLSEIDETMEKDKYVLERELKKKEKDSIFNSDITPHTSDDRLLVTQASVRNKNFFGDIMDESIDQTDNEFSKTYESYNGDEFFAQRTITTREHTTAEKFRCNPKEKAIVDEWRILLHDIKPNMNNGVTPTPQPNEQQMEELMPPVLDEQIDAIEDDDAVMVKSAEEIKEEQEEHDVILIEKAELIAPMTRIRGKFKLTSTSITFIPDQEQGSNVKNRDEINLATNPPPLPMSPHLNSSQARGRSSSYGMAVKLANLKSNGGSSKNLLLSQSASKAPSVAPSAHASEADNNNLKTPKTGKSADDGDGNFDFKEDDDGHKRSVSRLHSMVLTDEDMGIDANGNKQYWVTTSVCSSYQQVGGTRYRLMTAHRFWFIDELREIYYRRYQLRNCAFELFFSDDTSWLFNLYDENKRDMIFNKIMSLQPSNLIEKPEFFQNPKKAIKSSQIHHKWCRREISNFEYLMRLNTLAGRTFNDLTQYPVVPWVISDFTSDSLDLNDEKSYRDLSKPIGALNDTRLEKFVDRYDSLLEDYELCQDDEEKSKMHCFMYGTHYSSIGIILYYLLRMQPFTTYNLKFQGGKFDNPDRLFHSIMDTWHGCLNNTSDVKELIPEFYYLTDFLSNKQGLDLGMRQEGKIKVDDVTLPPWSKGSPEKFVKIMREALESEFVSNNLHQWIDLIFGIKQKGDDAVKANNVFHPYTYEGNVKIDKIEDPTERRAILSQIDEFGQTPLQLFTKAHPKRLKKSEVLTTIFKAKSVKYYSKQHLTDSNDVGIASISWIDKQVVIVGSDCCIDVHKWEQNKLSIEKKKNSSISKIIKIGKSKKHNKIGQANFSTKITHRNLCFATTKDAQYTFACGFEDNSFVVWDIEKSKLHQGIHKHNDIVSCLALDEDIEKQRAILVTGSYDKCVMVWRLNLNAKLRNASSKSKKKNHRKNSTNTKMAYTELIDPNPTHILDNQLAAVMCVDVSLKSGIIVCCSLDGIVNVYNASTGEHYHMLQPYIDKAMRLEKQKELKEARRRSSAAAQQANVDDEKKDDNEISPSPKSVVKEEDQEPVIKKQGSHIGKIPSGELTICRVSEVFGHVLCYSKQTKDIFLYSNAGELTSWSHSRDDIYYDIQFSKTGNHLVCGGTETIIRVKELPSFKTRKKFEDPKKAIRSIYLDKDETYMLIGLCDGNVLVYSLPQKAFVKSRVHTLTELGF